MVGSGISMLWNVVGIILPVIRPGFFQAFSAVPFVFYSESFYSGEAYDETAKHPFVEKFNKNSGIFYYEHTILSILIFMLIAQTVFYALLIRLYRRLKFAKFFETDVDDMENLKEL